MEIKFKKLTNKQTENIENEMENYDNSFIKYELSGDFCEGAYVNGELVGGIVAQFTTFKILYVSTLFVHEKFRGRGIGRELLIKAEAFAKNQGANLIRLDTFGFQAPNFYIKLGYTCVGNYTNSTDGYSEYFFIKNL